MKKMNITNEFCIFKLVWVANFTLKSLEFWDNFFIKVHFWSKTEKVYITVEFCISDLGLVPNFSSKWQILIFWTKFAQNWFSKILHFCMCPWSLVTILTLFARLPKTQQHFSVYSPSSRRDNKECNEYLFCKKFTFDLNVRNYLFIWVVKHWSVPSIFKTLEKM